MVVDVHRVTPDGRYFVVRGRLWRCSDPSLPEDRRTALVAELMHARRAVGAALRKADTTALAEARAGVDRRHIARTTEVGLYQRQQLVAKLLELLRRQRAGGLGGDWPVVGNHVVSLRSK